MKEVLPKCERPDCVIHTRLEANLFRSPRYPIKNLLLSVRRLRKQDESRKKEEEVEPFHCHVMYSVAVQFSMQAGLL